MRVLEERRILQSVAERAIRADVRQPDQSEYQQPRLPEAQGDCGQNQRKRVRVHKIVETRAELRIDQIPHHEQVRPQEEDDKERPSSSDKAVEKQAACERRCSL